MSAPDQYLEALMAIERAARRRAGASCECDWEITGHTGSCLALKLSLLAFDNLLPVDLTALVNARCPVAELHPDMLAKVRRLAELLRTQDNQITAIPIFMVQREERILGIDPDYCETIGWFHCDGDGQPEYGEEAAELEADYEETGEVPDCYYRTGYRDEWRNVQPFLTKEGAEEYIRINSHNLGNARIYVESGYRNAEWQFMRELILALAPEEASHG